MYRFGVCIVSISAVCAQQVAPFQSDHLVFLHAHDSHIAKHEKALWLHGS